MLEEKEAEWVVVRDPYDGELRVMPWKFKHYYVDTAPKWEFIADGTRDELRAMCRLLGGERPVVGIDDKGEEFDGFNYLPGEFDTPDTDE